MFDCYSGSNYWIFGMVSFDHVGGCLMWLEFHIEITTGCDNVYDWKGHDGFII